MIMMMTPNAQKRREHFIRHEALSLSVPTRRKWYNKVPPVDLQNSPSEGNSLDMNMSTISNQLFGAFATWHNIHASLMKLGLSSGDLSSNKLTRASSSSSTSASSGYSIDSSSISYISNDSSNGNQSSDESFDDKKLFNYPSQLSISHVDLRCLQLKEMFPGLSGHWRCF
uniref:Growth-regulating factor n=1 Tax=Elaeophora elaphi TaxID=1147741 RepID=A0A0R3RUD2_9BILA